MVNEGALPSQQEPINDGPMQAFKVPLPGHGKMALIQIPFPITRASFAALEAWIAFAKPIMTGLDAEPVATPEGGL